MSDRESDELSERSLQALSLLTETLEPAAPDAAARARLLRALHGPERFTPHAAQVARHFGLSHADAQHALRRIAEASVWQPGIWPNSRWFTTPALFAQGAMITELPAGTRIAHHRHEAQELTYVLDGELLEDRSRSHESGAFLEMSRGTEHEVAVSANGPCLVVFSLRRG